jgi:hypothetical protein
MILGYAELVRRRKRRSINLVCWHGSKKGSRGNGRVQSVHLSVLVYETPSRLPASFSSRCLSITSLDTDSDGK